MHVAAQLDHWPKWLGALKAFMADTYFIGVSKNDGTQKCDSINAYGYSTDTVLRFKKPSVFQNSSVVQWFDSRKNGVFLPSSPPYNLH